MIVPQRTVKIRKNLTDQIGYLFPNDEDESDRLDMMHEMMLVMLNRKLFLAPIGSSPQRVLDLGTGTGIWVMDFGNAFEERHLRMLTILASVADQFPSAEVRYPLNMIHELSINFAFGLGLWCRSESYTAHCVSDPLSLSDMETHRKSVPPNAKFIVDDFEEEWVYQTPFDFIHGRYLAGSVKDFGRLVQQAYKLRCLLTFQ
jgi:hypothetical protein